MRSHARKDEKPPPDQPGGLSDSRYTSHWRKSWPQGVDNSDGDADILDRFNKPDPRKIKEKKVEKYPWEYDKDVIDTGKSIEKGEEMKGDKLSYPSVQMFKGKDWTFNLGIGHGGLKTAPPEGVQGWDYNTEYTGDWGSVKWVDAYRRN